MGLLCMGMCVLECAVIVAAAGNTSNSLAHQIEAKIEIDVDSAVIHLVCGDLFMGFIVAFFFRC